MGSIVTIRQPILSAAARLASCVFLVGFLAGTAFAEPSGTLLDERVKRDQSRSFSNEARYTSEVCDTTITASIHWESFEARDGNLTRSYDRDCDNALSAIERICREGKWEEVAANIKRVRCGAGKENRAVLENGTLLFAVSRNPNEAHQKVYDYLNKKL
ncbi:MAG: hypothetical protein EP347_11955 [Alphaproteobacteria bacterium]|nr:MAG: hypothetical protein EP347_11955 [Alphaproteobacteria bacterium]